MLLLKNTTMSKTMLGLLFILAGVAWGSLTIDDIYNHTLGLLVKYDWIKPPLQGKEDLSAVFGRKPTILLYSAILILIGVYLLWNRNN